MVDFYAQKNPQITDLRTTSSRYHLSSGNSRHSINPLTQDTSTATNVFTVTARRRHSQVSSRIFQRPIRLYEGDDLYSSSSLLSLILTRSDAYVNHFEGLRLCLEPEALSKNRMDRSKNGRMTYDTCLNTFCLIDSERAYDTIF